MELMKLFRTRFYRDAAPTALSPDDAKLKDSSPEARRLQRRAATFRFGAWSNLFLLLPIGEDERIAIWIANMRLPGSPGLIGWRQRTEGAARRKLRIQLVNVLDIQKSVRPPGSLRLEGMQMQTHPVASDPEITGIAFIRIGTVGKQLRKPQNLAVIIFRPGRIRYGENRNGAVDHKIRGAIRPNDRGSASAAPKRGHYSSALTPFAAAHGQSGVPSFVWVLRPPLVMYLGAICADVSPQMPSMDVSVVLGEMDASVVGKLSPVGRVILRPVT